MPSSLSLSLSLFSFPLRNVSSCRVSYDHLDGIASANLRQATPATDVRSFLRVFRTRVPSSSLLSPSLSLFTRHHHTWNSYASSLGNVLARDRLSLRTIVIFATIFNLNAVGSLSRNDSWGAGRGGYRRWKIYKGKGFSIFSFFQNILNEEFFVMGEEN